jgi:hypothetical protein
MLRFSRSGDLRTSPGKQRARACTEQFLRLEHKISLLSYRQCVEENLGTFYPTF